jgi:hypothetical protein
MAVLRTDIERALDDMVSHGDGGRFQNLAVVLAKLRWPELVAHDRKADLGLDAYAPPEPASGRVGRGLACSITPTFAKISADAKRAQEHFNGLQILVFATSQPVTAKRAKKWAEDLRQDYQFELQVLSREDIITTLMLPTNAPLLGSFLGIMVAADPLLGDFLERVRQAAADVAKNWAAKLKGQPLLDLRAVRLERAGAESQEVFSLAEIDNALAESRRLVLEAPAGRGKTTTLIQLARQARAGRTAFMVDLPAWVASGNSLFDYLAGMPSFQARGIAATDIARAQASESFLFLLNGWNEVAESNSAQAIDALRELERAFPAAGIIVATRTHHLTPPLPGALRLRLLPLLRRERGAYLAARLAAKAPDLRMLLDAEPVLDELTRTPFILSEVAALFEASAPIPDTKIGVLGAVIHLQEEGEHRNQLQAAPLFGRAGDYLEALATEMTERGSVSLPEADARAIAVTVATDLAQRKQITDAPQPAAVLATLTAHHVLERSDYPGVSFRFGHQQFQEHYAALGIRALLLDLPDGDGDALRRYTADYVNEPAWAEPLRMIAETLSATTGAAETDKRNTGAGRRLVEMALAVDPIFAGELAQLSGDAVWREVRGAVGQRLRALYASRDENFRHLALAAMLATGSDDFKDIILPLLSSNDQQVRLRTYRLWPDISISSLGSGWPQLAGAWPDDVRADFVSEMLHHRLDAEIAAFAVDDQNAAVKKAAVSSLMWTRSDDAVMSVLESMDAQTFEDIARKDADRMPASLRDKTVAVLRRFIETTADQPARLRTALDLIELGETGLDGVVKDALAKLRSGDMTNLGGHYILPALEYLRKSDPAWVSEWVAVEVAEGVFYNAEYWMTFATAIPDGLGERYLRRLETENLGNARFDGIVAVIAAWADTKLASRLFSMLRELRRKVDEEPGVQHEFERAVIDQLEAAFRALPDDVAVAGILASVTAGEPLDIKVAAGLLSRVARSDVAPLRLTDEDLQQRLRAYLKNSVDAVLSQNDFNGEQKANLASSIAQLGHPEDMADLVRLIRADIERVRRGRAARAGGDHGPLGNGGNRSYSRWHIAAVTQLDPAGADQVLIDLLSESDYTLPVAEEIARGFLPKPERTFDQTFRYELMWAAREGRVSPPSEDKRRTLYAPALNAEIRRLLDERARAKSTRPVDIVLTQLASALATVDGQGSTATVLDVVSMPEDWEEYHGVEALERLLVSGVILPSVPVFGLVDRVLARTERWMQDSDRHLLRRALSLCAFVDDPAKGIARMREVLAKDRFRAYELREIVTALGESRSDAAVDMLIELASNTHTFDQCEDNFFNAFAALDTRRARGLLLGFIDPEVCVIALPRRPHREDVLVARITDLARREPKVATRLRELCERDLPELNRHILSKVMDWLGTPEALPASLSLIDDGKRPAVPQGIWDHLEGAFVERKPYGENPNVFTQHARASNELRASLLKMVSKDEKRRKAAYSLLGQIEEWRLDYGRPAGEPRHPDFHSGEPYPPKEPV